MGQIAPLTTRFHHIVRSWSARAYPICDIGEQGRDNDPVRVR